MISNNETLKSLDIVVIVYECDEVLCTTYLYGQPTDEEIVEHVARLSSLYQFDIVSIVK